MKYLIVGLENSATKVVAKIFATNLNIEGSDKYDGHKSLSDDLNLVQHFSFPYGENRPKRDRNYHPEVNEADWDHIIIVTRDFNCSLKSKLKAHQPNKELALKEHEEGKKNLKKIIKFKNSKVFSYESWAILRDDYVEKFLSEYSISYDNKQKVKDINKKHLK